MSTTNEARPDTNHSGAQKVYFVCFTNPIDAPLSEIQAVLPDHKLWAAEVEERGLFFAAGPFLNEDFQYSGRGMMIVRAASREEAESIVAGDPMHAKGLRKYEVVPWQLNEGTLPVSLRLSTGTLSFD